MRTFTCPTCRRRVPQSGCGIVGGKRLCGNCASAALCTPGVTIVAGDDTLATMPVAELLRLPSEAFAVVPEHMPAYTSNVTDSTIAGAYKRGFLGYTLEQTYGAAGANMHDFAQAYYGAGTLRAVCALGWQRAAEINGTAPAEQPAAEAAPASKSNCRPAKVVYQVWDDTIDGFVATGAAAVKLFETANANDARTFTAVYARTLKATPGVTKVTGRAGKGHSYIDAAGKTHRVTIEACDMPVIGSEPLAPPLTYRARLAGIAAAIEALRKSAIASTDDAEAQVAYKSLVGKATEYASAVATAAARERGVSRMSSLNRIMNVVRAGKPHSVAALDLVELDRPLAS